MKKASVQLFVSYFTLHIIACSCSEGVKNTWDSNGLRIHSETINIPNGTFCIHLLVDEIAVELKPQGPPVISQSQRETPAGPATVSTYTWTHDEGYEYALIVSQIRTEVISLRVSLTNGSLKWQESGSRKLPFLDGAAGTVLVQGSRRRTYITLLPIQKNTEI